MRNKCSKRRGIALFILIIVLGEAEIRQWFAKEAKGHRGVSWGVYFLYGSDATWEDVSSPLVGSGGTIYAERETLRTQLNALLAEYVGLHSKPERL